ncbi:ROK family transcriptional regulator [Pseudoscardovia suis]|uniref:NagC family transcriptional regulator n=1 Tax=Pseudoscardovia suis TaxID=987063 RepID=A0A261F2Z2_9BIFI|nr:ROK family transcriptional regulator [Pseudoscardovia suis]OZG53461.1 NagC family transcriptional regulator [Pseudoscardovia suis]PJJ68918.1 putative NBD/HSP70 family sugar kinase [Pseudoscardovia suis]
MAGIKASQSRVSELNRSHMLRVLYRGGIKSRAQIAQELDLTPAAVSKISARLIDAHAIEETSDIRGKGNRRSIGLRIPAERFHVIGVKFARTIVQIGVFDLNGTALAIDELPPVTDDCIADVVSDVRSRLAHIIDADPDVVAVGMAVPGPYLRTVGRTALVSSMHGWRRVNFLHEFGTAFRVPVYVEQDARAGVLAQSLFGKQSDGARVPQPDSAAPTAAPTAQSTAETTEGAKPSTLAYYLLGEGIGLGVIDHGMLINGELGAATEIGHVSIDVNGRTCDCGNVGCLERYCSATAIRHDLLEDPDAPHIAGVEDMTPAQAANALFKAAADGDQAAVHMVARVGRYVGYGCVTIINAFNPGRIVLGDIVAGGGETLLAAVQSVVDERVIPQIADATSIELSSLPTDSAISGAAAVAVNQFLDNPSLFLDLK